MDESIEEELLLAGSLYSNGQYEEALESYRETAEKWPLNGIVRSNLSALLLRVNRVDEAIEEAKEAVRLAPEWFKTHYRLGECHRTKGEYVDALLSYSKGLTLDHSNGILMDASLETALALFKDSFPLAALRRSQLTSSAVSILVCIGQTLLQQGVLNASREILIDALSLPSPSVTILSSLLSSLISVSSLLSLHKDALRYAKEYYELCENQGISLVSSLESIARESHSIGHLEESLTARLHILDCIEEDDPSRVSHLLHSADLYLSLDMVVEAAQSYTSVLVLDCSESDRLSARAGLALTVLQRGETREAIHLMEDLEMSSLDEKLRLKLIEFKSLAMMKEGTFDATSLSRLIQESSNPATVAKLSFVLAQYFISIGNVENALKLVKKSLGIAKKTDDFPLQSSSLILLSQIYEVHLDSESALSLLEHSLQLPNIPFKDRLQTLHRISSLLENLNRMDEAIERLEEAEKISEEKGNENGIIRSRSMIKNTKRKKEECAQSVSQLNQRKDQSEIMQEKLSEAQEMNNEVDEASICISLGRMNEEVKKWDEALHYYQQALTVSKQLRMVHLMGVSYLGVARVLSMKGEWSRVDNAARAAVTMARLMGEEEMEDDAMSLIGKTLVNKGEKELARRVYMKVLRRMKDHKEKWASIHFDLGLISDEESASYHFWTCFSSTEGVEVKKECLLHLSTLPSTSTNPHCLLRCALAYAIGEKKMESLLRLSRREREIEWIEEALQTSSFALIKYSESGELDQLIDDFSSFPLRYSSSLLLSLYSKRKSRRILFRLFSSMPQFVLQELVDDEEETEVVRFLCLSLLGRREEGMNSLPEGEWNDQLGISLPSFFLQMEKRRKKIEDAPLLMIEAIESNKIEELINQYDSLLLEMTQFECIPPPFAVNSFSFCTIILSLYIPSIDNLLHIFDLADWVMAGHGVLPPSSTTVPSEPFIRLFSCGSVTIIWSSRDDSLSPSYIVSSSSCSPLEDTLLSLLQSQSLPRCSTLNFSNNSLLIGMPPMNLTSTSIPSLHRHSLYSPPSLPLLSPSSKLLIIDRDEVNPSIPPVRISRDEYISPTILARKVLSCDICVASFDSFLTRISSPLLLSNHPNAKKNLSPSLVILTPPSTPSPSLHSLLFILFARGTKSVVILPNGTSDSEVEKIVNEICEGSEVNLVSILPSSSMVLGERFFIPRSSTTVALRRSLERGCLTSDSPSSSLVSTLLNVVPPSTLDHFLHLPLETKELNEMYLQLKGEESARETNDENTNGCETKLFNLIFNDHLMTLDDAAWEHELADLPTALSLLPPPEIKDQPISPPQRPESRGYQSEGENGRQSMIETSSFPSQGKYSVSAIDRSRRRRKTGKENKGRKRASSVSHSSRSTQ
ncbi:hypothetical protein PMAYCL1PPCAC_12320 [Pristionchus mayeri]|uniref:Uncharacterized protein n=1 Tax=Pristionchus mayeri TaxID=1317129 RepID=A0AAN5CE54_9BILA|nr:hypothetical protein PMAYCL1PPCAC_12320 [Pristionchus mayeri]